jgi:ATP-dependent Clp protease ATP-binding subunit ClpB
MDRLTSKFQEALSDAQSLAVGRDHQFIEPVHLMIALLDQQGGSIRPLFSHAGVNINLLRSQLGELLDKQPRVEGAAGDLHISNALGKLLNVTDKLAQERKDQFISSELFVLAAMDATSRRLRPRSTTFVAARRSTAPAPKTSAWRSKNTPST